MSDLMVATRGEVDRLVAPLLLAFASDPFVRWLLPDAMQYATTFPEVAALHAKTVVGHGGAYRSRDFRAVALWYPPGVEPDGAALGAVLSGAVDETTATVLSSAFEEVGRVKPTAPHMYLRMIGVDPAAQGRGHGSTLLRAVLDDCDRRNLLAYLEATSERSRVLYERHGFTTAAEVRVADAPPLWPMSRSPRPG